MLIKRIIQAFYLSRASQLAEHGQVSKALGIINRIDRPIRNRSVVEALRAYLQIVNDDPGLAKKSIEISRRHNSGQDDGGRFTLRYCDYLEAMIENRTDEFNKLSRELEETGGTSLAKEMLIVDRPFPWVGPDLTMH